MMDKLEHDAAGVEIAVIGMAGRFPGADNVDALWRNICSGVESVTTFSDRALREKGVSEKALSDPSYVKAGVVLEGMDQFDAAFFGYSPRDAEQLDPQHRLFLETVWQALEYAGHAGSDRFKIIGTYAGCGTNVYLLRHLLPTADLSLDDVASLQGLINGNDKDSLATRVAYKLDLRGPAITVQTACSTSLVAVHLACRGLLNHEADMALAGGVWLNLLQDSGYRYQPGAILSPDGHCRAFDARAAGTVIGSGAGAVVLKRLADAIADGDTIHAVIKGSALNNDGSAKVGYTAPSVDGQAEVILAAQAMAEVESETIGYVETHGTGTALGDPIEIAALTQAFRAGTQRVGYCAIGSVKTNIGHLDSAAGVTGLIKTVMALKHRTLPPSLNFDQPNPQIDFANSPFYVNTEVRSWLTDGSPRRAGVSSFGMGGTNVHVILEEAPSEVTSPERCEKRRPECLLLSARSESALAQAVESLGRHLGEHPELNLADVAHTLRVGRRRFEYRAAVLAHDHAEAARALTTCDGASFSGGRTLSDRPTVAFLFPGQGAQHPNMGRALYETEPVFRAVVDRCCDHLVGRLGVDLRELIYLPVSDEADAAARLAQTAMTQPALFVIEYALARLWLDRGLRPDAMLGHSIGEYVAACLANVFSLEDALDIVAARGQLVESTSPGAMLAVNLPEAELRRLASDCDLAAVNADELGVLSGPFGAIEVIEREMVGRGVPVRRLHVSHAFHSALLEPVLSDFKALVSRIERRPPMIPFVSNVTGRWVTAEEACSAEYWVRHLRGTVRFADGLSVLLAKPDRILLEVGPGETLSSLARRHPLVDGHRPVLASQCHPRHQASSAAQLERCQASLWVAGVELNAVGAMNDRRLRRVPLPTYPFERQSYWIAPPKHEHGRVVMEKPASAPSGWEGWFYAPTWRRGDPVPPMPTDRPEGVMLLLGHESGLSQSLQRRFLNIGAPVICVFRGTQFRQLDSHSFELRPGEREDFEQLLRVVEARLGPVASICHLWCLDRQGLQDHAEVIEHGFQTLTALAQALDVVKAPLGERRVTITVLANQVEDISGMDPLCPEKATLHGPCRVIPQEFPGVSCRLIDVVLPVDGIGESRLVQQIVAEMCTSEADDVVAYRGICRWTKAFVPVRLDAPGTQRLHRNGVYLITGGLGGIGFTLAQHLAQRWQARLVLIGRTALPPREAWPALVAEGDRSHAQSAQLRRLLELESLGAEVLVLQADVGDAAQMHSAVEAARLYFGSIDGVVHAAGVAGGGMISSRTHEDVMRVLNPKLSGARNLMNALGAEPLSFVLLCSSLTAVVGGFGQIDYCAANCFLDAYAASESQRGQCLVLSVNWDAWREVGMASGQKLPEGRGIVPSQGGVLLEALVNGSGAAQVLVSTVSIERQFAEARSTELADRLLPDSVAKTHRYPRPQLQTPYAGPSSEFESDLVALWGDFLGIASIGIHDNFFELGGDSLLAIQLLARVRHDYGVEVHPAALFKNPTVAALAVLVESRLIEEIENVNSPIAATGDATVS